MISSMTAKTAKTAKTAPPTLVAREAQQLFFQIGMVQRTRIGAAFTELGLTFAQAHALRLLDPDRPSPMSSLADLLVCDHGRGRHTLQISLKLFIFDIRRLASIAGRPWRILHRKREHNNGSQKEIPNQFVLIFGHTTP